MSAAASVPVALPATMAGPSRPFMKRGSPDHASNLSVFFSCWDRLFGTDVTPPNRLPPELYGIDGEQRMSITINWAIQFWLDNGTIVETNEASARRSATHRRS